MTDFQRDFEVIINNVDIVNNGTITFPVKQMDHMYGSIECLGLSDRAYNALQKNRIVTIPELTKRFDELDELSGIGKKSRKEIKNAYIAYYYLKLDDEQRKQFWRNVVRLTEANAKGE